MKLDSTAIIDYDYVTFRAAIADIASQVKMSDFEPDYIVGIVRGGAIPAVYLSHALNIPVVMLHWSSRDNQVGGNESNCWIPQDLLDGKCVLLVDDIVDGGETVRQIIEDWGNSVRDELPLRNVKVASLVYNTRQDVSVDFYHTEVDRDADKRWFVFDWEV